uniref:Uncharacterized protein n=1 Tax=viral metagenome TaxID=1070528 RepID=A0A6H1ZWJ3_9ZZZZ
MKRYIGLLLLLLALSSCDALEARRLNAEAAASRAKAVEISAAYDGKARVIEAKTAEKLAEQEIYEENLEARQAAATHDFMLRQLELERRAARRSNDLALLAIIGTPLVLVGGVAAYLVWQAHQRRQYQRRAALYVQIRQLLRRGQLRPMAQCDIEAVLNSVVPLEWYITAPATVVELPSSAP